MGIAKPGLVFVVVKVYIWSRLILWSGKFDFFIISV